MKTYSTYIFDMDGTLTDTLTVWLSIFRNALIEHGVTPPDDKTLSKHTHDWPQMLLLGLPEEKLEAFIATAHRLAKERMLLSPLHAGVIDMLQALKDHDKQVAVFSTMSRSIFEPAMEHHGLHEIIEVAIAGDDVPRRKPQPDGILKALNNLSVPKNEYKHAVYIGDKDTDIQAARNAGIDGVLYYPAAHQLFYNESELRSHNPTAVITGWQDLVDAL